jgi:hypothetical protein
MLDQHSLFYYRQRQVVAEKCARRATDARVRQRHQALASLYAAVVESKKTVEVLTRGQTASFLLPDSDG